MLQYGNEQYTVKRGLMYYVDRFVYVMLLHARLQSPTVLDLWERIRVSRQRKLFVIAPALNVYNREISQTILPICRVFSEISFM